ncbi:hypothetical protein [Luteolibacter marinus]|uniref:hypothetical protein n=1 Tax=Luteolibacter marinus TaxID=2776705 RepID=UPI0018681A48|nr:hypothetical protein [Luteolibacter marinus]
MKNKGCLIASIALLGIGVVLAVAIKRALTPWSLADKDPEKMLRMFVVDPPMGSISDIDARGVIAFAGGNALIEFRIDPRDVDKLLEQGRFEKADEHAPRWIKEFVPDPGPEDVVRYVRVNEGRMTETALFVAPGRDRVWFREIRF